MIMQKRVSLQEELLSLYSDEQREEMEKMREVCLQVQLEEEMQKSGGVYE